MLQRHRITTIGSTMRDIFVYSDAGAVIPNPNDMLRQYWVAFERAAKPEAERLIETYGGGAANTAVTFARMGLRPQILSAVGDDPAGNDASIHLLHEGVATRMLQRIDHTTTGTAIIVNIPAQKSHVALVYRGASAQLDISSAVLRSVRTPWVYLSALGEPWRKDLALIMEHIHTNAIKLAWNPGSRQLQAGASLYRRYLPLTEVFMVNRDEALELAKSARLISKAVNARSLARILSRFGARYTVVTDGHRGAHVAAPSGMYFQKAKIGKTVNKTGAGDAFGSGFVAGLIKYHDVTKALKIAAYNAHAVVGSVGAQTGILHARDLHRVRLV